MNCVYGTARLNQKCVGCKEDALKGPKNYRDAIELVAEVESLKSTITLLQYGKYGAGHYASIAADERQRAEKAEAEVEKLKATIMRMSKYIEMRDTDEDICKNMADCSGTMVKNCWECIIRYFEKERGEE
jgi:hypothetical protein